MKRFDSMARLRGVRSWGLVVLLAGLSSARLLTAATVVVAPDCGQMGTVTWSAKEKPAEGESVLTLQAKAATGFAFSGWLVDGLEAEWGVDWRQPSVKRVSVPANAVVSATFVSAADDVLEFDVADLFGELEPNEEFSTVMSVDSASFPTLKVSGLPPGLKFDASRLEVYGVPTTPGRYDVDVSGKNASGYSFWQGFRVDVAALASDRVTPTDIEVALGEYVALEDEDLFSVSEEYNSISISGLPPGVSWNKNWALSYGTTAKAGDYAVKAVVRFPDGTSETSILTFSVTVPDLDDFGVDSLALEGISVGDCIIAEAFELGVNEDGLGIVKIVGLPPGLSARTWLDEDGVSHMGIEGVPTKAGRYRVTITVADEDEDGHRRNQSLDWPMTVNDVSDGYLSVGFLRSDDALRGTATGGGVVPRGAKTSLTAKPSKGNVFAGWYDSVGDPLMYEGIDYRTPKIQIMGTEDPVMSECFARFESASDDGEVQIFGLDDEEFDLDADFSFEQGFDVDSLSLPTLSFKGLPSGLTCVADGEGGFLLRYDPETVKAKPKPGRYVVTATAANQSKVSSSSTFVIVVANWVDPRVCVADSYDALTPAVEMEPISLADAVRFDRGETLTVSGLPKGVVYNKAGKKGVEAYTLTGTPSVPGDYTLTFTAKVVSGESTNSVGKVVRTYETAVATASVTVLPYPELAVLIEAEDADFGNVVTGGGNYPAGKKVVLKAQAAKGWVFAGWYGVDIGGAFDYLNPSLALTSGRDDTEVTADFIPLQEDDLYVYGLEDVLGSNTWAIALGEDVSHAEPSLPLAEMIETMSFPTLSMSGLPSGLKFDAKAMRLSGAPKKAGVYYATLSAKNAGGYVCSRIIRIVVLDKDGAVPAEPGPVNTAGIDFSALDGLMTGDCLLRDDARHLVIPVSAEGSPVSKVTVKGVPAGLKGAVSLCSDGSAELLVEGVPTKAGRFAVSLKVTYADRTTASAEEYVLVEDGGSCYLSVESSDSDFGTVTGSGVYAVGATVKISAKAAKGCVFGGWYASQSKPFAWPEKNSGSDFRTSALSFPLCMYEMASLELFGDFRKTADDMEVSVDRERGTWAIDPDEDSHFGLAVNSFSLPKVTFKGLPAGVTYDVADKCLVYDAAQGDKVKPGVYRVAVTVQNVSKATASDEFEVFVANRTCASISGLNPDPDAYRCQVGCSVGENWICPIAEVGWTLSVEGIPSGLLWDAKTGVLSGCPTKAGDYTVTFVATKGSGKTRQTEQATVTIRAASLPDWAFGTFEGVACEESETNGPTSVGTVSLTISSAGKTTGKIVLNGVNWTCSAASYSDVRVEGPEMAPAEFVLKCNAKSGSLTRTFEFDVRPGAEKRNCAIANCSAGRFQSAICRNAWKDKQSDLSIQADSFTLDEYGYPGVSLSITKAGKAKFTGKLQDGTKVSSSATVFYGDVGHYQVFFIVPSSAKTEGLFQIIDL